jgi:hypothetical protein
MNTVTHPQDYAIMKHTWIVITQYTKFHGLDNPVPAVAQKTDDTPF